MKRQQGQRVMTADPQIGHSSGVGMLSPAVTSCKATWKGHMRDEQIAIIGIFTSEGCQRMAEMPADVTSLLAITVE